MLVVINIITVIGGNHDASIKNMDTDDDEEDGMVFTDAVLHNFTPDDLKKKNQMRW